MAVAASSAGAASADAVSSVCMGSSVELAAALSVIDEIDCRKIKPRDLTIAILLTRCHRIQTSAQ